MSDKKREFQTMPEGHTLEQGWPYTQRSPDDYAEGPVTHERFCSRRVNLGECDCNLAEAVAVIERLRAENAILREGLRDPQEMGCICPGAHHRPPCPFAVQ